MVSGMTGFSTNVLSRPISKKERCLLQMLVTKFHTKPETKIESGVKLNPVMRDLVINEHADNTCHPAIKNKRSRRWRRENKTQMIESVGENIDWWSALEDEITKLR